MTSSFNVETEATARNALIVALPIEWTLTTIPQASPAIRELAERTGGLRAGQSIFASAASGSTYLYGLWWPWGDGITTSGRIGLSGSGATQDALQRLRDTFSVEL